MLEFSEEQMEVIAAEMAVHDFVEITSVLIAFQQDRPELLLPEKDAIVAALMELVDEMGIKQ
jgi:hypothetical protein|tara:strand:- start:1114 stop:1299 length:186 start_codon:yes stop_codon:yes gene_type:complete